MFYSYAEVAYSYNDGVFPQWRGGFSLYANLPASFEGELGFRYLEFSGDPTWIYTAYIGKYYKSWLWGGRVYLTPATYSKAVAVSYSVSARYYYGSADDLIGASAGYGLSPDDRYNVIQLEGSTKLTSYNLGVFFKKKLWRRNVLSASANWLNQEYLPHTNGNFVSKKAWISPPADRQGHPPFVARGDLTAFMDVACLALDFPAKISHRHYRQDGAHFAGTGTCFSQLDIKPGKVHAG
jgi:YaiO family outer membrane protein